MNEQPPTIKKRTLLGYLKIFGCGFIMGGADVIPGVSGGTMAFILGIYNEFLTSLKDILSPNTVRMACKFQVKKLFTQLPWPFLVALGLGILTAILTLSTPLKWMLENKLVLILAFFFGLVAGSVITVLNKVEKWSLNRYIALLIGGVAGFLIVGLPMLNNPPKSVLYLLLCGAIAICAMVLPGISGSFILLLMGKYETILNMVHQLKSQINVLQNFFGLAIFMAGVVLGLACFVRFLSWLLKKYHDLTVAVLIGFMIGSLRKVWPWKVDGNIANSNILPSDFNSEFIFAITLAIFGLAFMLIMEYVVNKLSSKETTKID